MPHRRPQKKVQPIIEGDVLAIIAVKFGIVSHAATGGIISQEKRPPIIQ
jgi:hypothetical protein